LKISKHEQFGKALIKNRITLQILKTQVLGLVKSPYKSEALM
jgi:hypothetical protein